MRGRDVSCFLCGFIECPDRDEIYWLLTVEYPVQFVHVYMRCVLAACPLAGFLTKYLT